VEQEGKHEGANVACEDNDLVERLLECKKELERCDGDLRSWTESLGELSKIQDAFTTDAKVNKKKILDVGTDCVKPLYIALKFKPNKIIGISEELPLFASDLETESRLFTKTKIRLCNCSVFDEETFGNIRKEEKIDRFDFILLSKTLHHLRTGECIAKERDENHKHQKDETEKCCIYGFNEREIFEKLLKLGKRVIVYEAFSPQEEDLDKVRGRGGYFTTKEWKQIFEYLLSEKNKVEFIRPKKFHLDKEALNKVDSILRQVDFICFYVEK
jgi:hypothetical protein